MWESRSALDGSHGPRFGAGQVLVAEATTQLALSGWPVADSHAPDLDSDGRSERAGALSLSFCRNGWFLNGGP